MNHLRQTLAMNRSADELVRRELEALLPRLRRFAYGLTDSMDEGDDLLQATYERAIRNLDKWRPGTRLDSWMFRIAQNLSHVHLDEDRVSPRRADAQATWPRHRLEENNRASGRFGLARRCRNVGVGHRSAHD